MNKFIGIIFSLSLCLFFLYSKGVSDIRNNNFSFFYKKNKYLEMMDDFKILSSLLEYDSLKTKSNNQFKGTILLTGDFKNKYIPALKDQVNSILKEIDYDNINKDIKEKTSTLTIINKAFHLNEINFNDSIDSKIDFENFHEFALQVSKNMKFSKENTVPLILKNFKNKNDNISTIVINLKNDSINNEKIKNKNVFYKKNKKRNLKNSNPLIKYIPNKLFPLGPDVFVYIKN
jgi:hypothetical protein